MHPSLISRVKKKRGPSEYLSVRVWNGFGTPNPFQTVENRSKRDIFKLRCFFQSGSITPDIENWGGGDPPSLDGFLCSKSFSARSIPKPAVVSVLPSGTAEQRVQFPVASSLSNVCFSPHAQHALHH